MSVVAHLFGMRIVSILFHDVFSFVFVIQVYVDRFTVRFIQFSAICNVFLLSL